jgi:pyocin large subunit-like protein
MICKIITPATRRGREKNMNDYLYKEFLESIMKHYDPTELLLHHGINGVLQEFEEWLISEDFIKHKQQDE